MISVTVFQNLRIAQFFFQVPKTPFHTFESVKHLVVDLKQTRWPERAHRKRGASENPMVALSRPVIVFNISYATLGRGPLLRTVFLVLKLLVFFPEPLDSAGRIDKFLFASIEWMAHRADFRMNFFRRAAGLECVAAAATDGYLIIFRMYLFFHNLNSPEFLKVAILAILFDISI